MAIQPGIFWAFGLGFGGSPLLRVVQAGVTFGAAVAPGERRARTAAGPAGSGGVCAAGRGGERRGAGARARWSVARGVRGSGGCYGGRCASRRSQRREPARRGVRQREAAARLHAAEDRGTRSQRRPALRHLPDPAGEGGGVPRPPTAPLRSAPEPLCPPLAAKALIADPPPPPPRTHPHPPSPPPPPPSFQPNKTIHLLILIVAANRPFYACIYIYTF